MKQNKPKNYKFKITKPLFWRSVGFFQGAELLTFGIGAKSPSVVGVGIGLMGLSSLGVKKWIKKEYKQYKKRG